VAGKSTVTRVTLVRHGETDYNRTNRYMGRLAGGLTPEGRMQAERTARRLAQDGADALYTSPLERTRETAAFLEGPLGIEARLEPGFIEIDMGPWEGRDRAEVAAEDPARWKVWLTDPTQVQVPGMESIDALRGRVGAAFDRLAASHPGGHVVIVTHFACVATALLHAIALPSSAYRRFPIDNASLTVLRVGGITKLLRFNDTAHLELLGGDGVAEQAE
jgi:broad specificity phosphatase PhoE